MCVCVCVCVVTLTVSVFHVSSDTEKAYITKQKMLQKSPRETFSSHFNRNF